MQHIWCCTCGENTNCRKEDMDVGAVWECKKCNTGWGCVRTKTGKKVWITISEQDRKFHNIFEQRD